MRDVEFEDFMFLMDFFVIYCQYMSCMLLGGFGYSFFFSIIDGNMLGIRFVSCWMQQVGVVFFFGMLGMLGGFMDMFGMMNDMIGNMEYMIVGGNCQIFLFFIVIFYFNMGDGVFKVY